MRMNDAIWIDGKPAEVWAVLADPSYLPSWHPKCRDCDGPATLAYAGLIYTAHFQLSGPPRETTCTVLACEPESMLSIRYEARDMPAGSHVDERFVLTDSDGGTLVEQTVDLTRAGLPWWLRLLWRFIKLFGRTTGPGPLDGLKAAVESLK